MQTPPPDDRDLFAEDQFDATDKTYDPLVSDSDNQLYVMAVKKKAKAWPRSDHGFENEKAKCRKRISRLRRHMHELKTRHQAFMKARKGERIDSSDDDNFP